MPIKEQPKPVVVEVHQKEVEEPVEKVQIVSPKPVAPIAQPPIEEAKAPVEGKKPLRVIEIKGIKEKEESDEEEDDFNVNELWFEQAVQEE